MSDFWSSIFAGAPADPPEPTPPVSPDRPWWQRPVVDLSVPQVSPNTPAPGQPAEPDGVETLRRTQWARDTSGSCPSCGSENYMGHPEFPRRAPRCYDCGYPVVQSGSGFRAPRMGQGSGQAVKPARQTEAASTNNFNPRNVVDHLG